METKNLSQKVISINLIQWIMRNDGSLTGERINLHSSTFDTTPFNNEELECLLQKLEDTIIEAQNDKK